MLLILICSILIYFECNSLVRLCKYDYLHYLWLILQGPLFAMFTTNFNTQKFVDLPTGQIYMFCMDRIMNSFYFHIQRHITGFLQFK
jgi:hypothetical protein